MPEARLHLDKINRTNIDEKTRRGFIRLDMNEGIPGLPDTFLKEILKEIKTDVLSSYPEYKTLKEQLAAHNELQPDNICLSNGSDAAIKYIFDVYVSSSDSVLFADPTFAMYSIYCKMFNARAVTVEYKPDLSFPKGEFLDKISKDIKIAVVVNPNNPTGSDLPKSDLITILNKAALNDVLLIVDEAYFYYYPETMIDLVKEFENLVVLRTFSKLCGMAGARLGYVAAAPKVIENLKKVKPTFDVNSLAVIIGEKLMNNPRIITSLIKDIKHGKLFLLDNLLREGIEVRDTNANFLLINCNEHADFIIKQLKDRRILVGGGFKQDFLKKFIRVTIGDEATMKQFFKAFMDIWGSLHD